MTVSSIKAVALSGVFLGLMSVPPSVRAQSATGEDEGGIQLTYGVTFGVEAEDNRVLDPVDKNSATEAYIDLSLGLLSETRTQRFSFDLSGRLRNLNTDIAFATDNGFVDPFAELRYDTSSRNSRFGFSLQYDENDTADPETQRIDRVLEVVAAGTATRKRTQFETSIDWGDDRRFGFGLFGRYLNTEYVDGTLIDTSGQRINDSETTTVGARARFDVSRSAVLNTTLTVQSFEEDGVVGTRDSTTFSNVLSIDRPRGPVAFSLTLTDTEEGNRVVTSVGRVLEMPRGVLSAAIGTTRAATGGDTFVTGSLDYRHPLPRGTLDFGLARSVSSGETDDSENLRTQLNLRYTQDLTPVSGMSFTANWAENEETGSALSTTSASVAATYNYELTPDWDLRVGVRHRLRDSDVSGRGRNNTVFFEMGRVFVTRF